MAIFIIGALIFAVIFIFSSPVLSPIPYFPSQPADLKKIIGSLGLKNGMTLVDLGAGDGLVIFAAAREAKRMGLNTEFAAVEINPVLVLVMFIRRLFHANRKNIKIIRGDIFKPDFTDFIDFKDFTTVYLYISPWYIEKVISNFKLKISNFAIVSYMYPVKSRKSRERVVKGKNNIFVYK